MNVKYFAVVGLAACLAWTGAASANSLSLGTLDLQFVNVNPTRTGTIYADGSNVGNVYIGQYNLRLRNAADYAGPTGEGATIYISALPTGLMLGSFCADVLQYAPPTSGWQSYDVYRPEDAPVKSGAQPAPYDGGMGADKAADLRRLFYNWVLPASNIGLTADQAAAAQMAVWEIIFEAPGDPYNVKSDPDNDGMRTSSTASWTSLANTWLGSLGGDPGEGFGLRVLVNASYQDFAIYVPGLTTQPPPVPEPLTVLGVLLGVGGVAGYVRRLRSL